MTGAVAENAEEFHFPRKEIDNFRIAVLTGSVRVRNYEFTVRYIRVQYITRADLESAKVSFIAYFCKLVSTLQQYCTVRVQYPGT